MRKTLRSERKRLQYQLKLDVDGNKTVFLLSRRDTKRQINERIYSISAVQRYLHRFTSIIHIVFTRTSTRHSYVVLTLRVIKFKTNGLNFCWSWVTYGRKITIGREYPGFPVSLFVFSCWAFGESAVHVEGRWCFAKQKETIRAFWLQIVGRTRRERERRNNKRLRPRVHSLRGSYRRRKTRTDVIQCKPCRPSSGNSVRLVFRVCRRHACRKKST